MATRFGACVAGPVVSSTTTGSGLLWRSVGCRSGRPLGGCGALASPLARLSQLGVAGCGLYSPLSLSPSVYLFSFVSGTRSQTSKERPHWNLWSRPRSGMQLLASDVDWCLLLAAARNCARLADEALAVSFKYTSERRLPTQLYMGHACASPRELGRGSRNSQGLFRATSSCALQCCEERSLLRDPASDGMAGVRQH